MNQYTASPEVLRSLKAGLPPAAPPSRRLSPGRNGPRGPGKNLRPRCGSSRTGDGARASFCRSDPWNAPTPTLQRLGEYLQTLQGRSSSWRTYSTQALRMYRLHVGKPELADVVWLPRHKKDA